MTAIKGLGTTGNAAGVVTPLDHKLAQFGQVAKATATTIRPGLFWGGTGTIVTGTAGMSYSVAAYGCASSRGAAAGVVFGGNDGALSVATTAAPGSNSRYDVVYHWHREYSIDGVDSNPVIGVVQGTAAASPTVPSLAAYPGAIELARILVPAGVTATNTGTTITQTAPFTAMAGGVIAFRNATERDAGTYLEGQLGWLVDTDIVQVYTGAVWSTLRNPSRVPITPTIASTGGSVSVVGSEVVGSGAITQVKVTIPSASIYKQIIGRLQYVGGTSGSHTTKLALAGTAEATASAHRGTGTIATGGAATNANLTPGTSWTHGYTGSRLERVRNFTIDNLADTKPTTWNESGGDMDAATNDLSFFGTFRHTVSVALDGFIYDFTTMGTFTEWSLTLEGVL